MQRAFFHCIIGRFFRGWRGLGRAKFGKIGILPLLIFEFGNGWKIPFFYFEIWRFLREDYDIVFAKKIFDFIICAILVKKFLKQNLEILTSVKVRFFPNFGGPTPIIFQF